MGPMSFRLLAAACLAVALVVGLARSRRDPPLQTYRAPWRDTTVAFASPGRDRPEVHAAFVKAASAAIAVGRELDAANPAGALAALNAATRPLVPDPTVAEAVTMTLALARATKGAIDPTLGFLFKHIWRFDDERFRLPTAFLIAYARPFHGYPGAELTPTPAGSAIFRATPQLSYHLGPVAKGFAVRRAAEVLREAGLDRFLIDAGGVSVAVGQRAPRQPWRVGIQHPRRLPGIPFMRVALSDEALASVGDYERYIVAEGLRYHHIIDPRTGYPAGDALAASAIAPYPEQADALASAAFVLGEQAIDALPRMAEVLGLPADRVSALVVLPSGRIVHSDDGRWRDAPDELRLIAPEDDPIP